MLKKSDLLNATTCDANKNCRQCSLLDFKGWESCIKRVSEAALAYREALENMVKIAENLMDDIGVPSYETAINSVKDLLKEE